LVVGLLLVIGATNYFFELGDLIFLIFLTGTSSTCHRWVKSISAALTRLAEVWEVVDDAIGNNAWVSGDRFSAVDIYLYLLTTWLREPLDHPRVNTFPNVHRIAKQVMQRPTVQTVYRPG